MHCEVLQLPKLCERLLIDDAWGQKKGTFPSLKIGLQTPLSSFLIPPSGYRDRCQLELQCAEQEDASDEEEESLDGGPDRTSVLDRIGGGKVGRRGGESFCYFRIEGGEGRRLPISFLIVCYAQVYVP